MSEMISLEEIYEAAGVHPSRVKGCYVFGSRVYGTASENSDWDIILITKASSPEVEIKGEKLNIHVIVPDLFQKYVQDNHVKALECVLAPEWAQLMKYDCNFVVKLKSLRHNFSHTVSNSWVKCKKKLEQGDYYIGVKSLFHSLRIANFGIQTVSNGKIDFSSMNDVWKDIVSREWTWEELKEKYQPLRNSLMTEFRQLTEK